jgi:hypothetical protein
VRLQLPKERWSPNTEIAYENLAQAFMIILAGMNRYMLTVLVEQFHYLAKPNYLWPGAKDGHYLHRLLRLTVGG